MMLSMEDLQTQAEACAFGDPYPGPCPRCAEPAPGFSRHEVVPRTWWLPVDIEVLHVLSVISRWICGACGAVFTWQPPFSEARRRYVRLAVEERPRAYVEDKTRSYQEAASTKGIRLEHEAEGWTPPPPPVPIPPGGEAWPSYMARSTPWRWLGDLGGRIEAFGAAMRWIQLADPTNTIHRFIPEITPRKYRSEQRRVLLGRARHLLRAMMEIARLRDRSQPPRETQHMGGTGG